MEGALRGASETWIFYCRYVLATESLLGKEFWRDLIRKGGARELIREGALGRSEGRASLQTIVSQGSSHKQELCCAICAPL